MKSSTPTPPSDTEISDEEWPRPRNRPSTRPAPWRPATNEFATSVCSGVIGPRRPEHWVNRVQPFLAQLLRVLASLAENVRRLTATISGATTEDWRRRSHEDGATAGELVWRALHEAIHHLEEAGILLDGAAGRALTSRHNAGPAGQR